MFPIRMEMKSECYSQLLLCLQKFSKGQKKKSFAKFFLSLGNVLSKKSKNFSAKCDINETTKDDLGGQCLMFTLYEQNELRHFFSFRRIFAFLAFLFKKLKNVFIEKQQNLLCKLLKSQSIFKLLD